MSGVTHLVVGTAVVSPLIRHEPKMIIFLPFAVLGALLPDVDADYSLIKSWNFSLFYIALGLVLLFIFKDAFQLIGISTMVLLIHLIRKYTLHRTAAHSLLLLITFTLCVFPISKTAALYFAIGYATHLLLDIITNSGICLLYPYKNRISFEIKFKDLELTFLMYGVFTIMFQFI